MSDKSHFAFLIAFARQLERALTEDHGNDDVSDAVESVGASLGALLGGACAPLGDGDESDDDGVDDLDDIGDDAALGDTLASDAARGRPPTLDVPQRRIAVGTAAGHGRMVLGSERLDAPVLKGGRRGSRSKKR